MKHFALATAILAFAALPALANEATFERNLTVNGHVELTVSTGSGHIHLTHGSGDRVHIVGHVKSNWGGNEQRVQDIANNPPDRADRQHHPHRAAPRKLAQHQHRLRH